LIQFEKISENAYCRLKNAEKMIKKA